MHESLAGAISQIREEIGLDPFQVGEKVSCNLYNSNEIKFVSLIYSITTSLNHKLYLLSCPSSIGFTLKSLNIKVKNINDLDDGLYYRWVEEHTLELLISVG